MAKLSTRKVAEHGRLRPPQKCVCCRDMLANALDAKSFHFVRRLRDGCARGLVLSDFDPVPPSFVVQW
eukprot:1263695-Pyramimonas_sp.AAC.1